MLKSIQQQQEEHAQPFIVWGEGDVPSWLRAYGTVDIPVETIGLGADWVVSLRSALLADILRYGGLDQRVLGFTMATTETIKQSELVLIGGRLKRDRRQGDRRRLVAVK